MKQFWDDGHVAISFQITSGYLRLHNCVPEDSRPPFIGGGLVVGVRDGVAEIVGFNVDGVTRAHLKLIASFLLEKGVHTLVAERVAGHRLPYAKLETEGLFAGWWTINLREVRLGPR